MARSGDGANDAGDAGDDAPACREAPVRPNAPAPQVVTAGRPALYLKQTEPRI
jgi:hypothetical protein